MPELSLLAEICSWYAKQCNGEWEHSHGVRINTLDNPGWRLEVNLLETALEHANFETIKIDNSDRDWFTCFKKDGKFVGAGDPSKLPVLLEHFLIFAGK